MNLRNKLWEQGEHESATQESNDHAQFVDFFPNGKAKITLPINLYKRNKLWEQGEHERAERSASW